MNLSVCRVLRCHLVGLLMVAAPVQPAWARQTDGRSQTDELQDQAQALSAPAGSSTTQGLVPIPDYTGDLSERRLLLGDLGGARTSLASHGFQFDITFNQTVQSVVSGGRNIDTDYGGTLDYNLQLDLMKMGLVPGGLVTLRGESRYGESVNLDAGPALPVNTDFFFPLADEVDAGVPFYLTTLSYTQFFSDAFAIFVGKYDTLDGDPNEFASGRGLTQFQNLNFNFNPSMLVTVPYSTLGGGIVVKPIPNLAISTGVSTTTDVSGTTGFDAIGDGWTWASEAQLQYRLGHLPGGFNLGGTYAWDEEFATVNRRFVFEPGQGFRPASSQEDSWAMYTSVWQYLFVEDPDKEDKSLLNLLDGRPDLQGVGVFARAGWADDETNPVEFAFSVGVGGRGLIPSRDNDVFGIGYYHNEVQTGPLIRQAGVGDFYQGFEAFYNIAITPAAGLTLGIQYVEPVTERLDDAVVLGMRLLIRF